MQGQFIKVPKDPCPWKVVIWGSSKGAGQSDWPPTGGTDGTLGCRPGSLDRPHLLGDEGAGERDCRPEENAAAEDYLPVEAVAQVAKDGGSHHEAADEHCRRRRV